MIKLEDVLKDFEKRLSDIENKVYGGKASSVSLAEKKIPPLSQSASTSHPSSQKSSQVYSEDTKLTSSYVLGLIGILFVIMAGVFFIKMTIDSGSLTPMRQILLAAGVGLAFFLTPLFVPKVEKEYGSLLAGAGTTILHLTWFGAYFYHHLVSSNIALVCATLVGVLSVVIDFSKGSRLYLLVAMAGTYFAAPIVGYNMTEITTLGMFLIIWNISYAVTAIVQQRRDILFIASYYAVFTVLILSGKMLALDQLADLLNLQIIQFIIFAAGLVTYSIYHSKPLSKDESFALFPILLLFYIAMNRCLTQIYPEFAPWFGVCVGLVILSIYFISKSILSDSIKSGPVLTTFAMLTLAQSLYFRILEDALQPLASFVIGIFVLVIWSQSERVRKEFFGPSLILFLLFIYGAIVATIGPQFLNTPYAYNWAYGLLALFTVVQFVSKNSVHSKSLGDYTQYSPMLLGFAHLEIMLGLVRFSYQVPSLGALFVTMSWALYAVFILGISQWRKDKTLGKSALTILVAVSLKAFFVDMSNSGNLVRVFSLFAEGLLLYGCGWVFKKMQKWEA